MVQSEAGQDIWNGKINSGDACVYFFGSVPKKAQNTRCFVYKISTKVTKSS